MSKFKNLKPEEIAAQHQIVLDMLLHAVSQNSDTIKEQIAGTLDHMAELFEDKDEDATLIRDLERSISGER